MRVRSSMMVKRESGSAEVYVIGKEASAVLAAVSGISDVQIENQYVDRVTLSFEWKGGRTNFDSRLQFDDIDRILQSRGMHRMQWPVRAVIIVRRQRSHPSPYDIGPQATMVLESLPGVSQIRVDREEAHRATISYKWSDPGVHSPCVGVALASRGMQLV
jgi:hypothetical protein